MWNHNVIVDARGKLCPAPVIETKQVFEKHPGETIITLVDNEVSRDNVAKFATSKGYKVSVQAEGSAFSIRMEPAVVTGVSSKKHAGGYDMSVMARSGEKTLRPGRKVILLTKDFLGDNPELGRTLMKTFLFSLSESEQRPEAIFCINGAVSMVAAGSPHIEVLSTLAKAGVAIHSCGICLDFYGLKESVVIGDITNMYAIVEAITQKQVVTL